MRQRSLARSTSRSKAIASGSVESQYLVGSASPLGRLDQQPFVGSARGQLVAVRDAHAHPGKP
jgi:hypothetical protein